MMTDQMGSVAQADDQPYLIVGLGNPGRKYRLNRHNVGFMVVDQVGKMVGIELSRVQSNSLVATGIYQGRRIILAKPQTYMNLSGQAVSSLLRFYKVPLEHMLVIHDDLDLPYETLRLRPEGGSAGQKGLGSIIEKLGTEIFPRLRIGIGRPPGRMDSSDYVLEDFPPAEKEVLPELLEHAGEAVLVFIMSGIVSAMNQFNGVLSKE
jgi:PTH1 family peptidyl-tRNA hydrolase